MTGDVSLMLRGEGVDCDDDGFFIQSNDVVGRDSRPQWTFAFFDDALHLGVGPTTNTDLYVASTEVRLDGGTIEIEQRLRGIEGTGSVDVKGHIECARPASGSAPDEVRALFAEATGVPVADVDSVERPGMLLAYVRQARSHDVVSRLQKRLPSGWVAFIGQTDLRSANPHTFDEILVGPGRDRFDIVRIAGPKAYRQQLGTEGLVKALRELHALAPFEIRQAHERTIGIELLARPTDLPGTARAIHALCPGVLQRHGGSVAGLEVYLRNERRLALRWD